MIEKDEVLLAAKTWLEAWVIGLNLCPFAGSPYEKGHVTFQFDPQSDPFEQLALILDEVATLKRADNHTTLIVYPNTGPFTQFEHFLDFCEMAKAVLAQQHLDKHIQIACFHPDFVFSGEDEDDPANAVNRSPVPILHLLRIEDVEKAIDNHPDAANISFSNMTKLRKRAKQKKAKT